jgi:cytochrome c oxidase cbb3-type subunit III
MRVGERWRAGLVAVLALLVSGCQRAAPPDRAAAAAPAQTVAASPDDAHERGRRLYNFRCYFCHGYSGDARTLAATYLSPPPRDFTRTPPASISRDAMLHAVTHGRAGTAMKGFRGILTDEEIASVTDFVRREFMHDKRPNTRYHTVDNGWRDHERHAAAFPFARGELALDTPWDALSDEQRRGRRLFLAACVSCHDHGRVDDAGAVWEARPLTFPRDAYCTSCHHEAPDAAPPADHPGARATHTFARADGSVPMRDPERSGAGRVAAAYLVHDRKPQIAGLSALERRGEAIFQKNCAFCHAADGTAKGWIGRFLEPHPRDLTDPQVMRTMTRARLKRSIEDGLENTSMPAWKSVLGREEIDAVIAYIARAFHPVGS